MMTADQLRQHAQQLYDEYNDNDITKSDLFRLLQATHHTSARMYAKTDNKDYWKLCQDITGLIQDEIKL